MNPGKVMIGNQALPPIGDPVIEDPCIICGSPTNGDLLICSATCSDMWGFKQSQANGQLYSFQNADDWN